jgi:hypothetical protein
MTQKQTHARGATYPGWWVVGDHLLGVAGRWKGPRAFRNNSGKTNLSVAVSIHPSNYLRAC